MTDWWRGAVIYQIYPRSFQDSTGNGIGDLAGITRRLDHVANLGVDAIWISPVFTSPMADMGYDVSNYRDIDPLFGTLADFDALLARAHALGLKVIIDQVLSHSSAQHPWFVESRSSTDNPKADWYVWADPRPDGAPPNNWLSVFGGSAWTWDTKRRQYYFHNFLAEQPDLNFHEPAVQDEMLDTLRFWLDRGVDGFRIDSVNKHFHDSQLRDDPAYTAPDGQIPSNPYEMQDHRHSKTRPENLAFLERVRALMDRYDARCTIGEVGESLRSLEVMAAYTQGESRLHMAYSFDLLGPDYTPSHFRQKIEGFLKAGPDSWPCWSFSNHDVVRHATRWAANGTSTDAVAKQAIALLISLEGSLCLYQGEELGQLETDLAHNEIVDPPGLAFWPDYKGRDGCRTPMVWEADSPHGGFTTGTPWLPVKPPQLARAADTHGHGSVLEAYRRLLIYRRNSGPLVQGKTEFLGLPEPILAFRRRHAGKGLLCLFNLSPKPSELILSHDASLQNGDADLSGTKLRLTPNGWAHLSDPDGTLSAS